MARDRHITHGLWPNQGSEPPLRIGYSHGMAGSTPRQVAIVEDEDTIREAVALALRREGHCVAAYADGSSAWAAFEASLPDLVVLDIGLPLMDGLELCRRLRQRSDTLSLIFVTSREEEFDRVLGLELGADDYVCKPFSMRELVARVKVLLRRAALIDDARHDVTSDAPVVASGALTLDPPRLAATWRGATLPLTVTEFLLLQALAQRPGLVRTRDQLMDAAYPDRVAVSDRTIDSHIKRVRRKFEAIDPAFDRLESVYGAGYRYRP
jgi:two-component system response regulator ChvI